MSRVVDLVPGDMVIPIRKGMSAVYVAQAQHPIWPSLRLVVWRMSDGHWSHDALSPMQDVGDVEVATDEQRMGRLRAALLGGSPNPAPPGWSTDKWSSMSRRDRRAARGEARP